MAMEDDEAEEIARARELQASRLRNMNSLQWLAWQAELTLERGLDTCVHHAYSYSSSDAAFSRRLLGPPTEAAMRPAGAQRENIERQTHEREREAKRGRRRRSAATPAETLAAQATESEGGKIRTARAFLVWLVLLAEPNTPAAQEFEKQAAVKRRALEILELQREEEEWYASRGTREPLCR
jgi:hypothetical protein